MKKIAIEEHFQLPQLGQIRAEWSDRTGRPDMMDFEMMKKDVFPRLSSPVESFRLPDMDKNGIDIQILSSGSPGIQAISDIDYAVSLARECNDFLADTVRSYPNRFRAFAHLPLQSPKAAAKELERCILKLGFCGAMIQGHQNFHYLDEPQFYPIWEAAEALNVPLSLHVLDTQPKGMKIYDGCYELLGPIWSWNIESATHVMRLIVNGIFDHFPNAQFIVGHMGEGLPYYLGRMDEGYITGVAHINKKPLRLPSSYFRSNIYITTSGKYHPAAMRCAIDSIGAERILFACDYPFLSIEDSISCLDACTLTEEELALICHKNAEKILHITI